jgi:hypothetical protein
VIIEHRRLVADHERQNASDDLGEQAARRIRQAAQRLGVTLGEGVINWRRVGDLRDKGEFPPESFSDDDWLLEVLIPVTGGEDNIERGRLYPA